ncbi:unnamed protein product [Caenorhabditis bovis]|uniref:T20D4.11-like domain-containing protein n=1 Tax=Caenorhabditis bovis TaxID=2654633 RepID=A0A8S1EEE2_9PELO|nr:unnamed protein product [Caenorhabditis bovis]
MKIAAILAFVSVFGGSMQGEHDGEGCTPEENALIEKCKSVSKKHADLLAKANLNTDGPKEYNELAAACKEEVKCMSQIKCQSVRKFIDEGTSVTCQWAECSAKLHPKKDEIPCIKEYLFYGNDKEFPKEEMCKKVKEYGECVGNQLKAVCGAAIYNMHKSHIDLLGC